MSQKHHPVETNDYSFMLQSIEKKLTSSISAQVNDYYKKNPSSAKKGLKENENIQKENAHVASPKEKSNNSNTTIDLPSQIGLHSPIANSNVPFVDHSLSSIRLNPSVLKKRRISHDPEELTFDYNTFDPNIHPTAVVSHQPSQPFSKTITLQSQVDELTIINEAQKDQIRLLKTELDNYKDQVVKQLQFMESSNKKLKAELEEKTTKYYEDKKKWQLKVKEIEQKKSSDASLSSSASAGGNQNYTQFIQDLQKQLTSVNQLLKDKLSENENLIKEKVSLEKKSIIAENELKTLKLQQQFSSSSTSSLATDDKYFEEKLQLRKQISSLELKLQQKQQELTKVKELNKNQLLLDEEMNSLKNQILFYQEHNQEMNEMERKYHQLIEDKKHWNNILNKIMNILQPNSSSSSSSSSSTSSSSMAMENSPADDLSAPIPHTKILTCIQSLQEKYLLLLNEKNDLSNHYSALQEKMSGKDQEIFNLQVQLNQKNALLEKKENVLGQMSGQLKTFEREIRSLRELLQTYDLEFSLSVKQQKVMENDSVIQLKNEAIRKLQEEIDLLRKEYQELNEKYLQTQEQTMEVDGGEKKSENPENGGAQVSEWETKYNELLSDYTALQEITGMDYLPHKTKV